MPKKPTSIFLDESLLKRLDEWRLKQPLFVSRTAVIRFVIEEFLKQNKGVEKCLELTK